MPYIPEVIPADERARFRKGNMGARAGFGARPAVLVVDLTRAFDKGTGAEPDSSMRRPEAHEIPELIEPVPGEVVLTKGKPSAFFSHNYRVVIPLECVADRSATSHQVNLFDMDMKYADVVPLEEVLEHLRRRGRP